MTTVATRANDNPKGWRFWVPLACAFGILILLHDCFSGGGTGNPDSRNNGGSHGYERVMQ